MTPEVIESLEIGRLVVISHKRHDQIPCGKFAVQGGFAKIKMEFARHVDKLVLCVPVGVAGSGSQVISYPNNIEVARLPSYSGHRGFLRHLPSIVRVLWQEIEQADLVYAMAPNNMGVLGLLLARLRRKPVFLSIDTDRATRARVRSSLVAKLKAWLVVTTVYSLIVRLGGNRPGFITGDNFLGFRPYWRQWVKTTVTSAGILPYERHAPSSPLRVIFVGRLSREKNISCLIQAAALLEQEGVPCSVQIVGEGIMKASLEMLIQQLGLGNVSFMGVVPNEELRTSRFLGADVLVLPSKEERQGKVLLEAMAFSVPVAAARAGGIPSVVTEGENGLLFDPDSPLALAHVLKRIAEDTVLRTRLTENGYRFATLNLLDRSVAEIMREVSVFYGFTNSG